MNLIEIKNLHVSAEGKKILDGVDLSIKPREIHVLMGPNGSGKSTLSSVLAGHPQFKVEDGEIQFLGESLLDLSVNERSLKGLFLAFQYPKGISGVSVSSFLRSCVNAHGLAKAKAEGSEFQVQPLFRFKQMLRKEIKTVGLAPSFLERDLNQGFSGGEKKRCELLQMRILKPKLAILDEIDSGLDVDALKKLQNLLLEARSEGQSLLIITHYPQILQIIQPDRLHIMVGGRIVEDGGEELCHRIEQEGFERYQKKESSLKVLHS